MEKRYTVASLFAGVGGIDLGFEQAGVFETVYANEFDKNAQDTFSANFGEDVLDRRDIRDVDPKSDKLGAVSPDVLLAGFPCQAFSVAGYRKGFEDERGDLFFETMRSAKAKRPQVVFLENVKNLVTHDGGNTFKVIREFLVHAGYSIKWAVLNAKDFGNIPQNRERIYIVGFRDPKAFKRFEFPSTLPLDKQLGDVIDFKSQMAERYYYRNGVQGFYDELEKAVTRQDTVYQWRRQYVRENKSGVVPTLTANMGTGGHNVPLILTDTGEIRKLTPRETFNVQGFPETFKFPADIAHGQLYKQAGNSVVVPVITRIARAIARALEETADKDLYGRHDRKPAVMYTKMSGRMVGEAFPIRFFHTDDEREDWIASGGIADGLEGLELPTISLPIISEDDYYTIIQNGRSAEFLMRLG